MTISRERARQVGWRYERSSVPDVPQYIDRELIRRVERGWLLELAVQERGGELQSGTVTFVFKRPKLPRRRRPTPGRRGLEPRYAIESITR